MVAGVLAPGLRPDPTPPTTWVVGSVLTWVIRRKKSEEEGAAGVERGGEIWRSGMGRMVGNQDGLERMRFFEVVKAKNKMCRCELWCRASEARWIAGRDRRRARRKREASVDA